jgi:alkyldihydroxyacetonephosphate synthase
LAAVTLLFEGNKDEQDELHKRTLATAKKFNGMAAGAENGMRGYLLTFLIAYMRDFGCEHKISAESFETSVQWSNVSTLCKRVTKRIHEEAA